MDKPSGSIKSLLENENIRKKVSCFIQEEVVLPQWTNDQNKHIYEKLFLEKKTCSLNEMTKPLVDEQQSNQSDSKSSFSNVCGFNVNIKTLLQNKSIRRQVAPFIEKQIIIPVWSDGSDIEDTEINDITILPRNGREAEKTPETKTSENEPVHVKEEIVVEDSTDTSQNLHGDIEKDKATNIVNVESIDGNLSSTNPDEKQNQEVNVLSIKTEPETLDDDNQPSIIEKDFQYSSFASALKKIKIIKKRKKRFNALKNNPRKIGKLKIRRSKLQSRFAKKRSTENTQDNMRTSSYPTNNTKNTTGISSSMKNIDNESTSTKNVAEDNQETVVKEETVMPDNSIMDSITCLEEKEFGNKAISTGEVCNINDNADFSPLELQPIVKNETADLLEGKESETNCNINIQSTFTDKENLIIESQLHSAADNNQECEQNLQLNDIHHKKIQNRRWVVRRRRTKFLRGCFKCGKKYKRLIMLRNHEIKCKVESQDYECAMCPYKTKDQSIFKEHLENHILGNFSNEMILGNGNTSQTDLITKIKTEDHSGWGFIRLSHCPKCNWCNNDNNDDDKYDNDGDKLDRCSKCSANLLVYQSTPACAGGESYSACQDKIPFVRLTRLPLACSNSVPLPSPPPLFRFPTSISSNCEPPVSPPTSKLLSESNELVELRQKSSSVNQTQLQPLAPESILHPVDCSYVESDVELVKTEEFTTQFSDTDHINDNASNNDDIGKVNDDDVDKNYTDNSFDGTNSDLNCHKRRRTLKSSEWIQWFCQKCDEIQSSENFEVGWENKICKKCKAKLLYMCLKCDGKFSTYYTIAYHLRYCRTQAVKKPRRSSNKSSSSSSLSSAQYKNHINKKPKCTSCDKVFCSQMYLNRHKSICKMKDRQNPLSFQQNSPETSYKGFIHVSSDRKIPVFSVNQATPTT